MRDEDIKSLNEPYPTAHKIEVDRRFHSAIGADVPSAGLLTRELFADLTPRTGVRWWGSLPPEERMLIGDFLFQCTNGIELNLVEAKLHYMEWADARERENKRIVDIVLLTPTGDIGRKLPPALKPLHDLASAQEKMHVCGFFRAIGSSLDCLGAAIIGVLALEASLRLSDIVKAEKALGRIRNSGTGGFQIQREFRDFFENVKLASGPEDWLEWVDQYRNMFVHRGRRLIYNQLTVNDVMILDARGWPIPRVTSTIHLASPDNS